MQGTEVYTLGILYLQITQMLIKQCVAFFGDEGPLINACIICVKNVD